MKVSTDSCNKIKLKKSQHDPWKFSETQSNQITGRDQNLPLIQKKIHATKRFQ